jgi:hypothetical protein
VFFELKDGNIICICVWFGALIRERARWAGCASAGIGTGPRGWAAAGIRVRGHRERAPGADGGDACPWASGKGPGCGWRRGRVGIRKGPRGREAAGRRHRERAPGVGGGGDARPHASARPQASGKGPGGGRRQGRTVCGHRERGNGPGVGGGGDAHSRALGDTGIVDNKLIIFELATQISC